MTDGKGYRYRVLGRSAAGTVWVVGDGKSADGWLTREDAEKKVSMMNAMLLSGDTINRRSFFWIKPVVDGVSSLEGE